MEGATNVSQSFVKSLERFAEYAMNFYLLIGSFFMQEFNTETEYYHFHVKSTRQKLAIILKDGVLVCNQF